jgi:hypothetical protein|nr:MAG TPA: hypothetical protein [Caudoviricetes sp.]
MKRMLNRMSDTPVYRYSTGFIIAILSALKSTLMWVLEKGSLFLGITAIIAVTAIDSPAYRFIVLLAYIFIAPIYAFISLRRKEHRK